jgi:hypothetical protein
MIHGPRPGSDQAKRPSGVGPRQAIEKSINGFQKRAIFRLIRPFSTPETPR